jgi:hypothetical protein
VDGKRETEDGLSSELSGGAAGHAGAEGAPADDQRQVGKDLRDDREPGLVELPRRRWAPSAGDTIWLLDEGDA